MIVDTSAIVSVFMKEPGYEAPFLKMAEGANLAIGAPTLAETGVVLTSRIGRDARGLLARFLSEFEIAVIPFGEEHWIKAIDAYLRFGKGRHPASLNFGDCLSYATAKVAGLPLIFVGDDFSKTDLQAG
ncbi:MAG: type II toxin-antitoxin system VapC family toxin [Acidobacteriota bacterium]